MTVIWDSPAGQQAVEERYRAFLGHWPLPSEQLRVPTRQGETFAVACGPPQAPPVVLLHGADVALLPDSGHLLLGQTQRIGEFLTARSHGSDT